MALSPQPPHQEEKTRSPGGHEGPDERFFTVMQENGDVFWLLTPEGSMQAIGPGWQNFTGQEVYTSLGRGWLDAVHPDDQPQLEDALRQGATAGQVVEMECHLRRSDGVYRLVRVRIIPVRLLDGVTREIVVCGTDITTQELDRKIHDAQIQLVKASGVGTWDWDCLTDQPLWSDQEKALFGWSPDTLVTCERFLGAIHPDDREQVNRAIACMQAEQRDYHTDYRVIWPDGRIRWLSDHARGIADKHGKLIHIVGVTVDITDAKQEEEGAAAVLENITDAFSYVNRQWRYTYVNRGLEKLIGKKREEVVGRYFWDLLPELLGTPFERMYREAMEMRQTRYIEGFHPSFRRWLEIFIYPTPDGISFDLHDITERKQAEDALRESEARFHRLVESNLLGIAVIDADAHETVRDANDAFLELVGYTREDLMAGCIRWRDLSPPEYQEQADRSKAELLATGTSPVFEKEFVRKDGTRVTVQGGGTLVTREGSDPSVLCFVLDLTARKEIEHHKDLMLSMTSHELKTPLAALKGTLQLTQRRLKRAVVIEQVPPAWQSFCQDLTKSLQNAVRQIDVQTNLINDLLDASRITAGTLKLEPERCDLVALVRETVEDLRVTAPERSLTLDVPEQPAIRVFADRARISQVVTNYVTNAIRYSRPDQPVQIGFAFEEDKARVWVRDRGPGISEEAQKELWQRFHQIKGVPVQSGSGKGLGLGLYICQTLITQHQGAVGVESTPGEGSTFWFTLPIIN